LLRGLSEGDGTRTRNHRIDSPTEAHQKEPENTEISPVETSACRPACRTEPADADLERVVAAWPDLPDAIRRAVLALIGSSANG
jgi:hypothetical protein